MSSSGASEREGAATATTDLVFRAGLTRLVVGLAALLAVPRVYPTASRLFWVYVAYLTLAVIEQALILRKIGSAKRSIVFGVIDGAILTLLVHQLGTSGSVLCTLYLFAGVINALVISPRVGLVLVSVNAAMYASVVLAEQLKMLPYAPDVPHLFVAGPPAPSVAIASTTLVIFLLFGSTYIVARLHRVLRDREAALVTANLRLEELSVRDPLTGLFNRRFLLEQVERQIARAQRGAPTSVMMIDLDHFKRVNDRHGHLEGDRVLCEVAASIRAAVRSTDIAARYGGDEFVVVLPDTPLELASAVAERIVAQVREVGRKHDADVPVTASVGIALASTSDDGRRLVQRADVAAYAAKKGGGDNLSLAA